MKLAVIQHSLHADALADARAAAVAVVRAVEAGAELVVVPALDSLADPSARRAFAEATSGLAAGLVVPLVSPDERARVFSAAELPAISERLGAVALLYGDACIDPAVLERTAKERPAVLLLAPRSEGDLQAEAMLELAVGLSESAAGLVVVADPVGGEFGRPGHGGSAVVLLGDVMAEAFGEETLLVDVPEPVPVPEPRDAVPEVPTLLQQRLANHEGRHLDPGYLADLS